MEEDIKILEEFILNGSLNICCFMPNGIKPSDRIKQSLENLIKGYRELEEKNKQCIKAGDLERAVGFLMNRNDLVDFIPKSKIKEIRDKAEVMDYYVLSDVIDDLNKLLEEK